MLSHLTLGVGDFERAHRFHAGLMALLGHKQRFADAEKGWAGWRQKVSGALFVIMRPFDGQGSSPGNGAMVAFRAESRDMVDKAHAYALAHGGTDEGPPGIRSQYHPDYYGAYFRDPDGNKLCVVCHEAG